MAQKSVVIAVISGVLTIAGATTGSIIKSFSDIELERAKLDSQLILNAIKEDSIEQRRESLRFLVEANLIGNQETKDGLKKYFSGSAPLSPPKITPFVGSNQSIPLNRTGQELANKTDVDIFVCGKDKNKSSAKKLVNLINTAINNYGGFGAGNLKTWENDLYKEIPLSKLTGKTTVVMDRYHPEYTERFKVATLLGAVPNLPKVVFVNNSGKVSPWRISIIVCEN